MTLTLSDLTALGKGMAPAQVREWAQSRGYTPNTRSPRILDHKRGTRIVLGGQKVRLEVRSGAGWVRISSGYYKDLFVTPEGLLGGTTR